MDSIDWLVDEGFTDGFVRVDGYREYRPMANITRCDMAAFLYRISGEPDYEPTEEDKEKFSDVIQNGTEADTSHYKEVLWLAHMGISTGFPDGTFRPYDTVKRCDMAAFLYRTAGEPVYEESGADATRFNDVDAKTDHRKEVLWLANVGISTGFDDGGFHPYAEIVRCDMAAFLERTYKFMNG